MIKYNQFGEVISVNGLTTGHHLGTPMQDAICKNSADNECYATERNTKTHCGNMVDDKQPEPISGGASSWNDLKDKPFYSNGIKMMPLFEGELISGGEEGFMSPQIVEGVNAGEDYTIKYNGVDYVCTAIAQNVDGLDVVYFGNGSALGFDESTEPFFALVLTKAVAEAMGMGLMFVPMDGATSVTLGIYHEAEDIKKLDNKFLDLEWIPATTEKEILAPMELTTNSTKLPIRFNDLINYKTAVIYFDGVRYERPITHNHIEGDSDCGISFSDGVGEGNMNWLIRLYCSNSDGEIMYLGTGTHTLSISVLATEPLPEKFLPAGGGGALYVEVNLDEGKVLTPWETIANALEKNQDIIVKTWGKVYRLNNYDEGLIVLSCTIENMLHNLFIESNGECYSMDFQLQAELMM